MPNRQDDRMHLSDLAHIGRSPAHYRYHIQQKVEPTRSMLVGSAVDALVFSTSDVVSCGARRGTKDWEARESNAKKCARPTIIVNDSELEEAMFAVVAIANDPVARKLFDGCEFQTCLKWVDDDVLCAYPRRPRSRCAEPTEGVLVPEGRSLERARGVLTAGLPYGLHTQAHRRPAGGSPRRLSSTTDPTVPSCHRQRSVPCPRSTILVVARVRCPRVSPACAAESMR